MSPIVYNEGMMVSAATLTGAAGEHHVMSQLLRRGLIAALAPAGVPNCDIVVTDDIGDRLCAVQVKTRNNLGSDGGWHMRKKHEGLDSPSLFYCFVDFGDDEEAAPVTWVVPAPVVARALSECHQAWLAQPGKKGQQRNDNDMRRLLPAYDHLGVDEYRAGWLSPYLEAWGALQQPRGPG
ncbi:hypothetical protein ABDK56_11030 [Sphingomonas sp. ASV193]|uniref:hypothetical protein n=1 Tax=Sphingomonas sp. ASV193 TaxID=3144405 RepID=UPI0032E8E31C